MIPWAADLGITLYVVQQKPASFLAEPHRRTPLIMWSVAIGEAFATLGELHQATPRQIARQPKAGSQPRLGQVVCPRCPR